MLASAVNTHPYPKEFNNGDATTVIIPENVYTDESLNVITAVVCGKCASARKPSTYDAPEDTSKSRQKINQADQMGRKFIYFGKWHGNRDILEKQIFAWRVADEAGEFRMSVDDGFPGQIWRRVGRERRRRR
ncbi:12054_t:CDS:2 [Acaulospora colombiana]|uniref:12054_t:CDS:1 n=1 Tax=Acaulospora colombiana TaxID=27376 RepID=A0ACA9KEJ6_9GLOM|nr:12054_t:CDS:2 [Acaulospora colombiana]